MKSRRGLSLAEIMVALGVASIAMLTLIMFVSMIYRAAREGKNQAAASTVARKCVERLRTDASFFAQAMAPAGASASESLAVDEGTNPVVFTTRATCRPIAGTDERYYDVTVQVDWTEQRDRSVGLQTVLPKI